MKEAKEELRNMRQMENESIAVYTYKWGWSLPRSPGILPRRWETSSHVFKDFVMSLKKNIRNKIANRWAEMRNPPRTVQEAFKLADEVESQLQVADSFKLELSNNFSPVEVNEMSAKEKPQAMRLCLMKCPEVRDGVTVTITNEYKYNNNHNLNSRPQYNKTQENKTGKNWGQKEKDSQDHFDTGVIPLHSCGIQWQLLQTIRPGSKVEKGRIEEAG